MKYDPEYNEIKHIQCELCGSIRDHTHYRIAHKNYGGVTKYGRVRRCGCTAESRAEMKERRDERLRGHGCGGNFYFAHVTSDFNFMSGMATGCTRVPPTKGAP